MNWWPLLSVRAKYFLCSASLSPRSLVTRPLVSTSQNLSLAACFREAALGVVLNQLLGNTDTGRTGAHEDQTLLLNRHARQVHGPDVAVRIS